MLNIILMRRMNNDTTYESGTKAKTEAGTVRDAVVFSVSTGRARRAECVKLRARAIVVVVEDLASRKNGAKVGKPKTQSNALECKAEYPGSAQ